jgi:hypothetical protein
LTIFAFAEVTEMAHKIFLFDNHLPLKSVKTQVIKAPYGAFGKTMTTARFRGIKIVKSAAGYEVVTWQRNIARMQKMDVSLPTVITLSLDEELKVKALTLDESFAGSQGISCCQKYLQKMMRQSLEGKRLVPANKELITLERLHCLHTHEVLLGALTFLEYFKERNLPECGEVETGQAVPDGDELRILDYQQYSDGLSISWEIILYDYQKKIQFGRDGAVKRISDLALSFSISINNGKACSLTDRIDAEDKTVIVALSRFALKCWKSLNEQIGSKRRLYNNNILPVSIVGLIIQSIGIVLFSNNYNYIQHLLAALQRRGDKPLCVGIAKDLAEIQDYFPQFTMEDLY